ncbi:PIN domain containing protein [Halanaeroarchaeum sp. HSR-CO]|uniref:type II toxin-antitoxin system VapC family toxin n=1 Tax=Halanaeroarchaeum sp. HSR-CO TaxID=2866382 RepID=UPI00217D4A76|nr:type II toxin-antitoxin system VapC family toxin [Halanaeroarchaeum sp. HSR-CO]UWG48146.1 PIN domain containing protein [Halanaeroarchaeum sp. HSR-CO]
MKLLDTSVVVDIDRGGVDERVAKLDAEGRHAISAVTATELRLGVEKQYADGTDGYRAAVDGLERLLARFELVPVSRPVALSAAKIIDGLRRGGNSLNDLHDVYIGATARTEQLPVLTGNVAQFSRIADVDVVDWAEY